MAGLGVTTIGYCLGAIAEWLRRQSPADQQLSGEADY
jgi:hypothetical protein